MTSLSGPGVGVLLMGTGSYPKEYGLAPIPAVPATLHDLREVLVRQGGADKDAIRVLEDPATSGSWVWRLSRPRNGRATCC